MAASKYDATYTPSCTTAHCMSWGVGVGGAGVSGRWRVLASVVGGECWRQWAGGGCWRQWQVGGAGVSGRWGVLASVAGG